LVRPLHKIAPRSSHVNLPGRDLNPANICAVCRVNLPDFAEFLDFGLDLRDFAHAAAWSSSQAQLRVSVHESRVTTVQRASSREVTSRMRRSDDTEAG
jgi:hypothetical protein